MRACLSWPAGVLPCWLPSCTMLTWQLEGCPACKQTAVLVQILLPPLPSSQRGLACLCYTVLQ